MPRPDDPSSRPVSKPSLKAVPPREARPRATRKKIEEKAQPKPEAPAFDADFGVAMLIRGTEQA